MQSNTSALGPSFAQPSAWDARLIRLLPTTTYETAPKALPLALILAIGMDLSSYRTADQVWQSSDCHVTRQVWHSNGYFVTPLDSVANALDCIRNGDFDLVLLGNSVPLYDKKRLSVFIRSLGSRVRVISVAETPQDCADFADASVGDEPSMLLHCMRELLAA
jgi:hypothetical protein